MEFFNIAKEVRLRSHHKKYLYAYEDEESVILHRRGSSRNARWTVEFINNNKIRLKSLYGKYLAASFTACCFMYTNGAMKVIQMEGSGGYTHRELWMEWEPVTEGDRVKLKTRYGSFLRANGCNLPCRNAVTHDRYPRKLKQDLVLWDVDVLEILPAKSPELQPGTEYKSDSELESIESGSTSSSNFSY
ncbi:hypothetical protein Vadar_033853 [Vaccinium darrowii]|uniref:Uncharacterized protein n=1 Tax=Vaccinium darrowii TaxID=229202 RepID=A0ACB7X678_9ERIC|nr:hypothetical protein Vadar_033853 [Vaccinium darrowii]